MVWVSFDGLGSVISRVLAFVGVADWFWFGWDLSALTTISTANPSALTTISTANPSALTTISIALRPVLSVVSYGRTTQIV